MEQLTATAAYNEVKKIQRMLDSLSKLGEVLSIVANEEKLLNELKESRMALSREMDQVKLDLASSKADAEAMKKRAMDLSNAYEVRVQEVKEKEAALVSETGQKLEAMKKTALGQVEAVRMELAKIQPQVNQLRKEKDELENNISLLKTKAAAEMETMFNALKKMGN